MTSFSKIILTSLASLSMAACGVDSKIETKSAESSATPSAEKLSEQAYVKPGASVTMEHNFKGFVQPGSSGTVQVSFTPSVDAGTMRVEASSNNGLAIKSDSMQKTFKLGVTGAHTMDVGFSTQTPGPQSLNFYVYTTDAMGQTLARAFSVPIQVGDPKLNPPAKRNATIETTPSGESIVVMEAEETIIQSE